MNVFPLSPKATSRAVLLGAIALFMAAAYHSAMFFLSENNQLDSTPANQQSLASPTQPQKKKEYGRIARWHLFGSAPITPVKTAEPVPVKAPETRLKLELLGVFFDQKSKEGWAIISEPGKPHKSYKIGDKLPGESTLHALEAGRIILSRNNRHESLTLKQLKEKQLEASPLTHQAAPMPSTMPPVMQRGDRKIAL